MYATTRALNPLHTHGKILSSPNVVEGARGDAIRLARPYLFARAAASSRPACLAAPSHVSALPRCRLDPRSVQRGGEGREGRRNEHEDTFFCSQPLTRRLGRSATSYHYRSCVEELDKGISRPVMVMSCPRNVSPSSCGRVEVATCATSCAISPSVNLWFDKGGS